MMNNDYRIFVVDDDSTARLLLNAMLGGTYAIECLETGAITPRTFSAAEQLVDLYDIAGETQSTLKDPGSRRDAILDATQ